MPLFDQVEDLSAESMNLDSTLSPTHEVSAATFGLQHTAWLYMLLLDSGRMTSNAACQLHQNSETPAVARRRVFAFRAYIGPLFDPFFGALFGL